MSKKVRIRESVIEEKADVCFLVRATLRTSVYASVVSLNITFLRKSSLITLGHLPLLNIHLFGDGPSTGWDHAPLVCHSLPSTQCLPAGDPASRQCPKLYTWKARINVWMIKESLGC